MTETSPQPNFDRYDQRIAEAMLSGMALTGIPDYLGIVVTEVGPGKMTAELDVRKEFLNPFGSAHGGVLAGLVDHILGAVLLPLVPSGAWPASNEFKINYLAPVYEGTLRASSEVISLSKRIAVMRIDAFNNSRLVGAAQGTVTISAPRAGQA